MVKMKDGLKKNWVQNAKWFIFLHIIIFMLSIGGVLSKLASKVPFMSHKFIILYMLEILILFFYALAWQQVIKHIPLTVAFCNKAISAVWSLLFGIILFKERISAKQHAFIFEIKAYAPIGMPGSKQCLKL